jgi:hypothetical protein
LTRRLGLHIDELQRPCNTQGGYEEVEWPNQEAPGNHPPAVSDLVPNEEPGLSVENLGDGFSSWFDVLISLLQNSAAPALRNLGSCPDEVRDWVNQGPRLLEERLLAAAGGTPFFDRATRKLYFRGRLIRNWSKTSAKNQLLLVQTFQAANWPPAIPNPLSALGLRTAKEICGTTVRDFNKKKHLIVTIQLFISR